MNTGIVVTRMEPSEAITLTKKVRANLDKCIKDTSAEEVGEDVATAVEELEAAAEPLVKLKPAPYSERRLIDLIADRTVAGVLGTAEYVVSTYDQALIPLTPSQQAKLDAAGTIIVNLYPDGKGFTQESWVSQFGNTEMLLEQAGQPEMQDPIECLNLGDHIGFLTSVHQCYGELMGFTAVTDDGEDSLAIYHQTLQSYIAAVAFTQRKNPELREKLLAPYIEMAEEIRAKRRRSKKKLEG